MAHDYFSRWVTHAAMYRFLTILIAALGFAVLGYTGLIGQWSLDPEGVQQVLQTVAGLRGVEVEPVLVDGKPTGEFKVRFSGGGIPSDDAGSAANRSAQFGSVDRSWLDRQREIELQLESQHVRGHALVWDDYQVVLISDRGRLHFVPWAQALGVAPLTQAPPPLTGPQLQQELVEELGSGFTGRGSGPFVVIQPRGSRRDWARSMHQFMGNVQTYCSARQIKLRQTRYPLVAIVQPNRAAMLSYARGQGEKIPDHYLAYYSLESNRVVMYDPSTEGDSTTELDLATVFHEAFHQIAFNAGLHRRTAPPPLWVSEGMASAFETTGMSDHRRSRTVKDRVHPDHLRRFLSDARSRDYERQVSRLLQSDALFRTDPDRAYALSWAMAFYWMENAPQAYSLYLDRLNQQAIFTTASPDERIRDFMTLSQCGVPEFAERLKRYYERME
jgi:hypothetical protein